jgi:hypothetical protein
VIFSYPPAIAERRSTAIPPFGDRRQVEGDKRTQSGPTEWNADLTSRKRIGPEKLGGNPECAKVLPEEPSPAYSSGADEGIGGGSPHAVDAAVHRLLATRLDPDILKRIITSID